MEPVKPAAQPRRVLPLRNVDHGDATLLHQQVAAEIRRAITDGEAGPGDRIPRAKDLAAVLGVNTNTVLRALRMLQDEGLLNIRRGWGTTVTGTSDQTALIVQARNLISLARSLGYRPGELTALIEQLAQN
ncbi:MAG: GntR family transcriptional regulator [Mycobacteriales bacterium]